MKAIIIFFEGQIGPNQETDMMTRICEQVFNHTTANIEQISACTLDDKEVTNALVKHVSNLSQLTTEKEDPVKEYCKLVIEIVGSPALADKDVYRKSFLKCIQNRKELRNAEILKKIERNSLSTSQILKTYGLEILPSYMPDIRAIFKVFDYGKI